MNHYLESDSGETFLTVAGFNLPQLKQGIISHLTNNPTDTVEHSKDLDKDKAKKYTGRDVLNFYTVNPINKEICKLIIKGQREYFKSVGWGKI